MKQLKYPSDNLTSTEVFSLLTENCEKCFNKLKELQHQQCLLKFHPGIIENVSFSFMKTITVRHLEIYKTFFGLCIHSILHFTCYIFFIRI